MNSFLRRMLFIVLGRQLLAFILRRRPTILSYGRQVVLLGLSVAASFLVGWLLVERDQTGQIKLSLRLPTLPPSWQESLKDLLPQNFLAEPQPMASLNLPEDNSVPIDDLTIIDGIGKSYARLLYEMGVRTFAELAERDPGELARQSRGRISAQRIRNQDWIGQARQLRAE
ncbi:MAG: DUF4332 domain-containing protein [Anaerolineae bacterium]|nr:DUF4332 domain-containing protein [Anaerolineae bacterium]